MELKAEIGKLLRESGLKLSVAESATGGIVASMLIDIPGSSDYFLGGVVSYANQVKMKVLGVREETLQNYGAVSPETAAEMADGVKRLMNTDIAVADTGIAGPTGGSNDKPIGLFYLGISTREGTLTEKHVFQGDRAENRMNAAMAMLNLLHRQLKS